VAIRNDDPRVGFRIVAGPHQGEAFDFDSHDTLVVGRAPDAQWRMLKDLFFSRYHFRLEVKPPWCRLEDLESTNGTMVNGKRVHGIDLRHGDRIECGETVFAVAVEPNVAESKLSTLDIPAEQNLAAVHGPKKENFPRHFGEFELTRELGRGAMGIVYHGIQRASGREVAIKVIQPAMEVGTEAVQCFAREASTLSKLRHPRIIEYYNLGMHQGQMYLAMEYLPVVDFAKVLAGQSRGGQIRLACGVIGNVLEALEYAHEQGVVHRDVKPQNMLFYMQDKRLHVKLADFGLAKSFVSAGMSSMTRDEDVRGTLGFMAPEQLLDCRYAKPACDIYSAGACLYYFLCGQMPFEYGNLRQAIAQVLDAAPVPLVERAADVPREVAAVVHQAMARDPNARYNSAALMREAVRQVTPTM
jgi:eukaryotic-like serine/threonine-protein kinase